MSPGSLANSLSGHLWIFTIQKPEPIGDIDGDGVVDFVATFSSKRNVRFRWIDAISGKNGEQIWRKELPATWFDKKLYAVPKLATIDFNNPFLIRSVTLRGGTWKFRDFGLFGMANRGEIMPWPIIFPNDSSTPTEFFLSCGDRLISINCKTGESGSLNDGQPVQLKFFPALPPKPIHDANGELQGLLLCEEVAKADSNNSVAPLTRFSLYSCKSGSRIWSYDADCDPSILGFAPDWPIVADLTGDSDPEILIVDGGDLEVPGYEGPTCLSSLQLLDSKTGKPLWDSGQLAKIRCQDRQIQNVVVGPDADGDNKPDVYAVTSMINEKAWIYVDVLDGNNGTRIKAFHADVPMFSNGRALDLETPLLIGGSNSRDQRLVVSTKFIDMIGERASTVVMSLETGEILNFADQLEHPLLADGDGDGHKDVFLVKPKSRDRIDLSGQFVSLKAVAGVGVSLTGSRFVEIGDVNDDGVHDLIEDAGAGKTGNAISGADGKLIHGREPLPRGQKVHPLNADVDSDGVDDFVMESSDNNFSMSSTVSYLSLIHI